MKSAFYKEAISWAPWSSPGVTKKKNMFWDVGIMCDTAMISVCSVMIKNSLGNSQKQYSFLLRRVAAFNSGAMNEFISHGIL